jgi:hypothetical protein
MNSLMHNYLLNSWLSVFYWFDNAKIVKNFDNFEIVINFDNTKIVKCEISSDK